MLSVSLIHGFMAGDAPELGTRMIVVTDDDRAYGEALAEKLGREVFALRGKVMMEQATVANALDRAASAKAFPVVIADMWDNPGGGTAGIRPSSSRPCSSAA